MPDQVTQVIHGLVTRAAAIEPTSIDEARRTVEVVWSTGAAVKRSSYFDGDYIEELSLEKGHVRLERLEGAPVLDTHSRYSLRGVLGVVESPAVKNGVGTATLRFSDREDVEPIWRDVKAGILRQVSVGGRVHKFEKTTGADGKLPVYRAVDWEPQEISLVPIGADPGATVRADDRSWPCEIVNRARGAQEEHMTAPTTGTPTAPATDTTRERERIAEIQRVARVSGLDASWAADLIDRGVAIEDARNAAFDALAARSEATRIDPRIDVGTDRDSLEERIERMAGAVVARMRGVAPDEASRGYVHRSLVDHARELLAERGDRGVHALSPSAVIQRAHTTSDFPLLVGAVTGKFLLSVYEAAPLGVLTVAREREVKDYKKQHRLRLGEFTDLPEVGEGGEVPYTTIGESDETFAVKDHAAIIGISNQALVNDDLSAFEALVERFGWSAREKERQAVVALLALNSGNGPTLSDGNPLFHTAHGNKAASGGAIDVTTLGAAVSAMRLQKGLSGTVPIGVTPRYLAVPAGKETVARQYLAQINPSAASSANPWAQQFELVVDPRLDAVSATRWYAFADPAQLEVIEIGYLAGQRGPHVESRPGWNTLGVEIRCVHTFGVGAVDWRGAYANAGG